MRPLVLMYHGVISSETPAPEGRETGADLYDTTADQFRGQLDCLRENGFRAVLRGAPSEPGEGRPVIITFDDGEKNNHGAAFPMLKERGWPAYFFVTASRVGRPGYMDWNELSEMAAAGMVIGSHGLNHEPLTGLSDEDLMKELAGSREMIEAHLKKKVETFSVPRGFYDERVIRMTKKAGYKLIFVSERDPGDPACVTRVAVKGGWPMERFRMVLDGRLPLNEAVFNGIKGFVKSILSGGQYNRLRTFFLKNK